MKLASRINCYIGQKLLDESILKDGGEKKKKTNGNIFSFQCFLTPKPWGLQQHLLMMRIIMRRRPPEIPLGHSNKELARETEQQSKEDTATFL